MVSNDEEPHPCGVGDRWAEFWDLSFMAADGSIGGFARLTSLPNLGRSWFWSALTGPGRPLIAVVEHELPPPKSTLELRGSGIWVDLICEDPFVHFTLGLEAFGLELDEPADVVGHRTAVGFDLEWESSGAVGYPIGCSVHGEILLADEVIDFSGAGMRHHRWGADIADLMRVGLNEMEDVPVPFVEIVVPNPGGRYRRALTSTADRYLGPAETR